jgi:hypothetical protein
MYEIRRSESEQPERLFARDAGFRAFAEPAVARKPHHRLVFWQQPSCA